MHTTKPYSDSRLEKICVNVRQQLLANNAIKTKSLQLGIHDAEISELLDKFIDEWIEHYKKNSIELKTLTGWILFDTVKRRFLEIGDKHESK